MTVDIYTARPGIVIGKSGVEVDALRKDLHAVRAYTRCNRCGRPRAVYRRYKLCRICLRDLAHDGAIPGMTKSSW